MIIKNPLGQDPSDLAEESAARRVGRRIRKIRIEKDMSQAELGEKVGLSADRIQQYENGYRKPKHDLIKSIASALGVETMAIIDPVITNYLGLMYALFEMEDLYGLNLFEKDGNYLFQFEKGKSQALSKYLHAWHYARRQYQESIEMASNKEEQKAALDKYNSFKWTFPNALSFQPPVNMQRQQIQDKIAELEKQLADLEDE